MDYTERTYRLLHRQSDLLHFQAAVQETDLDIGIKRERFSPELVEWVYALIQECRKPLEEYIKIDPDFQKALSPYRVLPSAPLIAERMAEAGRRAGVGPMAAVAGAIAETVGQALQKRSKDVIVENGGDIYLLSSRLRYIGIFAGESPLSNRLSLEIRPEQTPLGICTSSGTVGPSLSFGQADAVVILSPFAALADAVATAVGNLVQRQEDLEKAIQFAADIGGVAGAVIIKGEHLAAWGHIKLVPMQNMV